MTTFAKVMDEFKKQERIFYLVCWTFAFAFVPLTLVYYVLIGRDQSISFQEILSAWLGLFPFLLLFLLHNDFAAPLLKRREYLKYFLVTLLLLGVFGVYCFTVKTNPPMHAPGPPQEMYGENPPPEMYGENPPSAPMRRPMSPEVMRFLIGVLLVVANIGIKSYFQARRNEARIKSIEAETLAARMETLRYQINPHFFMNTLNNIHALVDIDPEKAKESIEAFSKLMRIVLYDGNAPTIPLGKEMQFIEHYVSLMRIRYLDSVEIKLDLPEDTGTAQVPPLVMASFMENAFKHGVSYREHSYIHISVALKEGKVVFKCCNSRHPAQGQVQHGLGLENVRKRLDLMYPDHYTLNIEETPEAYSILLVIPSGEEESV